MRNRDCRKVKVSREGKTKVRRRKRLEVCKIKKVKKKEEGEGGKRQK